MRTRRKITSSLTLTLTLTFGCGGDGERQSRAEDAAVLDAEADAGEQPSAPPASAYVEPPALLSEWNLFAELSAQRPGPRTLPYDVIAPLFSDYTNKHRFVYVPEGETIGYDPAHMWKLPEGSVLIKTFSYPLDARDPARGERLLETRLLVFTAGEVVPHTYVWNDAQTEATRRLAGARIAAEWIDGEGATRANDYTVPNSNKCFDCHGKRGETDALGLRTRQLDRDFAYAGGSENQLDHMFALGLLDRQPEPSSARERLVDPFGDAALALRARSYLDVNCAQCHKQGGDASASGMWLDWASTAPGQDPATWGVCKRPTSADGATCEREVDIVPGQPERSIYMCRVESSDPKIQMPPLGRNLVHAEGVALLREWIGSLPGACL